MMGLESYRDKAREALAGFLRHAVTCEGRLYGAMLPEEHPFSFCQLLGVTAVERDCLFSACGFLSKTGIFSPWNFDQFLCADADLQTIQGTKTGISTYSYKKFNIYAIGYFAWGTSQFTFNKQENELKNGSLKPIQFLPEHREGIRALLEHLLSLPDEEENSGEGGDIEDSEGGVKNEENMGVEAAVSGSAEQVASEQSEALEQSTLEEEAWEQEARAGAATKKHSREDVTYNYFCCRGIPSTILQEKGVTIGPSGIQQQGCKEC